MSSTTDRNFWFFESIALGISNRNVIAEFIAKTKNDIGKTGDLQINRWLPACIFVPVGNQAH